MNKDQRVPQPLLDFLVALFLRATGRQRCCKLDQLGNRAGSSEPNLTSQAHQLISTFRLDEPGKDLDLLQSGSGFARYERIIALDFVKCVCLDDAPVKGLEL